MITSGYSLALLTCTVKLGHSVFLRFSMSPSGGRRTMFVRKWKVWEHMRDYFPVKVSFGQISLNLFTSLATHRCLLCTGQLIFSKISINPMKCPTEFHVGMFLGYGKIHFYSSALSKHWKPKILCKEHIIFEALTQGTQSKACKNKLTWNCV